MKHRSSWKTLSLPGAAALGALALAFAPGAAQTDGKFTLDPKGAVQARAYMPIQIPLSPTKPEGIKKEPTYRTAPKYGVIRIGNGPKATYFLALDEPEAADYKVYLDKNRNGDLTDDGDGAWGQKKDTNGRILYGPDPYVLRASWGTPEKETSSGDYGVAFYRFSNLNYLLMYRQAARVGAVTVDGKEHKALLIENDTDGLFAKPLDDEGKPVGGKKTNAVWLIVDLNDDGKFDFPAEMNDARSPFKLGEKAFEANISADGSSVKIMPTTRKVADKPKPAERPALLAAGVPAPDFTAEAWGGGTMRLSDYKGKVVILDFWATWCGPCQRSMPHLEKVYQAVKDKGVVVLGVAVWENAKADYEKWVPANQSKYSFKFAYDPAGRDTANSIARKLFNVSGIPTTYIIDKEGKVVEGIVGFSGDADDRIEKALKKVGVEISTNEK